MWLKYVKGSLLGLSLFAGLASVAGSVNAATVALTAGSGTQTGNQIVVNPTTTTDTVTIVVSEDSVWDVEVVFADPPVTNVVLNDGENDVATGTSNGTGYALRYSFIGGQSYSLITTLSDADLDYTVRLSAVPLPAAAWMFLSVLFGGAWVKRRGARSKSGVVATA